MRILFLILGILLTTMKDIKAHLPVCQPHGHMHELRWDWSKIDTTEVSFSPDFLWGAAICEFQTSGAQGCPNSNWAHWEATAKLQSSGVACDSWNLYHQDIALLKELGLKAYRFSVDWSVVEPKQGVIDEQALQHYQDFCDALLEANIQPVVTLHHFVHPQWFEELGAFEKEENNRYFIDFSKHVFEALGNRVALWCTINEPGIYVMQGYVRGVYPPGRSGLSGMRLASKVLKNLLNAHVAVYQTLKQMPGGKEAQIGIVHQYLSFERFHGMCSPLKAISEHMIGLTFTSFVRDTIIEFFKTGTYHFRIIPFLVDHKDVNAAAPQSLDFIGLNYYSHVFLRIHHRLTNVVHPGYRTCDIPTGMPFAVYAEGFYRAIKHVAELNVPIYITENGAPTENDTCRDIWIRRYVYALSKAIEEGCDVRGYFYWSLMDNYEWDMGYKQKFGLYHVDFATQKRTLRPGSEYFKQIVQAHSAALVRDDEKAEKLVLNGVIAGVSE